jgi:hypothetical protein
MSTASKERRPKAITALCSTKYGLIRRYDFMAVRLKSALRQTVECYQRREEESKPFRLPGSTVCRVCRIFKAVGALTYFGTSSAYQQRRSGKIGRPKGPKETKRKRSLPYSLAKRQILLGSF